MNNNRKKVTLSDIAGPIRSYEVKQESIGFSRDDLEKHVASVYMENENYKMKCLVNENGEIFQVSFQYGIINSVINRDQLYNKTRMNFYLNDIVDGAKLIFFNSSPESTDMEKYSRKRNRVLRKLNPYKEEVLKLNLDIKEGSAEQQWLQEHSLYPNTEYEENLYDRYLTGKDLMEDIKEKCIGLHLSKKQLKSIMEIGRIFESPEEKESYADNTIKLADKLTSLMEEQENAEREYMEMKGKIKASGERVNKAKNSRVEAVCDYLEGK